MPSARSLVVRQLRGALKNRASQGRLVLTASLSYRRGNNLVRLSLAVEAADSGQPVSAPFKLEKAFAAFGQLGGYRFPEEVLGEIAASLEAIAPVGQTGPLWLRLVRPCGYLGLLPWEASLSKAGGRPVLRLPDFPYRAVERTEVLENIVLVDPPPDADNSDIRDRLERLATSIVAGSSRSATRVHVFASSPWQEVLAAAGMRDPRILLHPPRQAPATGEKRGDAPIAQWIEWILGAMERRGADAIHIVGRAALDECGACVRLSASPCDSPRMRRDVDLCADDLALLLNRAGAWSASFVPASSEDAAPMALAADDLAHRWHGAVLFSDLGKEKRSALRQAARLLYTAEATSAPRLEHGFLSCHPDFLMNKRGAPRAVLPPLIGKQAARLANRLQAIASAQGTTGKTVRRADSALSGAPSSWVAATQRFVEKEVFDEIRRHSGDVLLSRVSARVRVQVDSAGFDRARAKLLDEASAIVSRYRADSEEEKP